MPQKYVPNVIEMATFLKKHENRPTDVWFPQTPSIASQTFEMYQFTRHAACWIYFFKQKILPLVQGCKLSHSSKPRLRACKKANFEKNAPVSQIQDGQTTKSYVPQCHT